MTGFRWPALICLPALIIIGLFVDQGRPTAEPDLVTGARTASSLRPDDSASATWFCVAGVPPGSADLPVVTSHNILVVNTTRETRQVRIVAYSAATADRSEPEALEVELAAGQRFDVPPTEEIGSVMVEIDGGGVLVEHKVGSELGSDTAPCASTSSSLWEFPAGETLQGTAESIVLFNPFPEDAVAQLAFTADTGRRIPAVFESVVVPGRSFKAFDVTTEVTQAQTAAATIDVNAGRVIAERVVIRTERDRGSGLTSTTGTPGSALVTYLPIVKASASRLTEIVVYNPSDERAEVDIELRFADDRPIPAFEVPLPPLHRQRLDLSTEPRLQELLAEEVDYSIIVRSANGVPVTAEVSYTSLATGDEAIVEGVATMIGSPLAATRWLVHAPLVVEDDAESSVAILNPSFETIARVDVTILDAEGRRRSGGEPIEIRTGGRRTITFDTLGAAANETVIFEATSPIVVGRQIISLSSISMAMGLPDSSTLAVETNGIGF